MQQNLVSKDLFTMFVEDVCAGKTNETPAAYWNKLQYLQRYLDENQLSQIDQKTIDGFRKWILNRREKVRGKKIIQAHLSPFTIRTVLTTVRHFLRWGCDQGLLTKITLVNIKEPFPDPKAITQNTFQQLLESAQKIINDWERLRNVALLLILRDTGGRCGAIARIEIENIDLETGVVTVRDKGDRLNCLFLTQTSIGAIKNWLEVRNRQICNDNYLFQNTKGYALKHLGIRRTLNTLAEKAGVKHERHNPHSFRHAFARDTLLAGADLSQTSQLMNHTTIITTARYYARWSKRELVEIHRRFSPLNSQINKE